MNLSIQYLPTCVERKISKCLASYDQTHENLQQLSVSGPLTSQDANDEDAAEDVSVALNMAKEYGHRAARREHANAQLEAEIAAIAESRLLDVEEAKRRETWIKDRMKCHYVLHHVHQKAHLLAKLHTFGWKTVVLLHAMTIFRSNFWMVSTLVKMMDMIKDHNLIWHQHHQICKV
jgi:hypothetical protein